MTKFFITSASASVIIVFGLLTGCGQSSSSASIVNLIAERNTAIKIPHDLKYASPQLFEKIKAHAPSKVRLLAVLVDSNPKTAKQDSQCPCKTVTISTLKGDTSPISKHEFLSFKQHLKRHIEVIANKEVSVANELMKSTRDHAKNSSMKPIVFINNADAFSFYTKVTMTKQGTSRHELLVSGTTVLFVDQTMIFIYPHYHIKHINATRVAHAVSWIKKETKRLIHGINEAT